MPSQYTPNARHRHGKPTPERERPEVDPFLGWAVIIVGALTASAYVSASIAPGVWFLTMWSHFHGHLAVAVLIVMFLALFLKRFHWMALAAALVAMNVAPVMPHFTQALSQKDRAEDAIEYYIHDLGGRESSRQQVADFLGASQPELVVLFGITDFTRDAFEGLRQKYAFHVAAPVRGDAEDRFETLLLSRLPIADVRVLRAGEQGRPFAVMVRVEKQACKLNVAALRLDKPFSAVALDLQGAQFEELVKQLDTIDGPLVVMGGHGTSPWAPTFKRYLTKAGLDHTGGGFRATWPAWAGAVGLPFDHVLTRTGASAASARGPAMRSAHKSIYGWAGVPDRSLCP